MDYKKKIPVVTLAQNNNKKITCTGPAELDDITMAKIKQSPNKCTINT